MQPFTRRNAHKGPHFPYRENVTWENALSHKPSTAPKSEIALIEGTTTCKRLHFLHREPEICSFSRRAATGTALPRAQPTTQGALPYAQPMQGRATPSRAANRNGPGCPIALKDGRTRRDQALKPRCHTTPPYAVRAEPRPRIATAVTRLGKFKDRIVKNSPPYRFFTAQRRPRPSLRQSRPGKRLATTIRRTRADAQTPHLQSMPPVRRRFFYMGASIFAKRLADERTQRSINKRDGAPTPGLPRLRTPFGKIKARIVKNSSFRTLFEPASNHKRHRGRSDLGKRRP